MIQMGLTDDERRLIEENRADRQTDSFAQEGPENSVSKEREMDCVDPWADRAKGMRCSCCMWFVVKSTGDYRGALGRCRRRSPTMSGFPVVFGTDWCGDHKLSEVL